MSYTDFINKLADVSGEVIRKYYRMPFDVESKSDNSPVTIADKEAEQVIRKMIMEQYPDHGIIGEEFGRHNENSRYKWVVDPIDGTASFVMGRPIFGTLIALVEDDKPILGVIDQPVSGERWIGAKGQGAFLNGKKISVRDCKSLKDAVICTTGPQYFDTKGLEFYNKTAAKTKRQVYGGDCYNYALLASGFVDVVIESGLKPHDFCAVVAVVEAAGGVVTDWNGNAVTLVSDGNIIACGSREVLGEVLGVK